MFQKLSLKLARVRGFRAGIIVLCVLGVILLVAGGSSPLLAEPGTVTVRVDPATRAAPVNGTFTVDIVADVDVEMEPTGGLGAYEFDLVYDTNYLEVNSVDDAGELDDTGRTVSELGPVSIAAGQTAFGAYSYYEGTSQPAGPSGTVVLATVTLQAKRAGMTTLNLENALLTDTQANAWPDGGTRVLNTSGGMVWNIIDAFSRLTDFDGDGKDDPALWRPDINKYTWRASGSGYDVDRKGLGPSDGIPLAGDYDGDGYADPAIYSPSGGWFKWKASSQGYTNQYIGIRPPNSVPLVGDFDGDGKDDPAIWIPDTETIKWKKSGDSYKVKQMGLWPSTGIPLN